MLAAGEWCLSLVVSSSPVRSTMIFGSLAGVICISLCLSIKIKPTKVNFFHPPPSTVWYKTKFCLPILVTICAWVPKLVANISSQFRHLVNTGLTVGFLSKWQPVKVAHTCKLETIWVVYCSPIENGSIRLKLPLTYCAQVSLHLMVIGVWNLTELIGAHSLKKLFVPALEANFLKKLPHSLEK